MAARLGTAVVVIAALAIGGLASAQASEPCCVIAGPIAWGEVAFLAEDVLAVPTGEVVEADAAQRAAEAARRRAWQARPREERLDELVERDPDEGEAMYRFRRWVAERYLEFLDRSPAPEGGTRRLTGLGVALFRLRDGGIEPMAKIPLWRGDVPVHSQISHHGGLGGASWTLEMVNAWAGAHPGPRWTVLWAWPDRGYGGEPLAALLRAVDPPEPEFLGAFLPLDWQDADSLIALGRRDGAWWLLRVRLDSAGTLLAEERLAPAPSPSVTVTVAPGGSQAIVARGFLLERLFLDGGRREPLRIDGRPVRATTCGAPLAASGRVWLSEGPVGRRLLALGMKGNRLDLLEAQALPWSMGEPEWCSPLAAGPDGLLVLARRELHRRSLGGSASAAATTPWLSLHLYDPERRGAPQALGLPPAETQLGARPVALSPSGRWLAVRHDALAVRLWPLSPTVPTR